MLYIVTFSKTNQSITQVKTGSNCVMKSQLTMGAYADYFGLLLYFMFVNIPEVPNAILSNFKSISSIYDKNVKQEIPLLMSLKSAKLDKIPIAITKTAQQYLLPFQSIYFSQGVLRCRKRGSIYSYFHEGQKCSCD
jgi:hypothetical protein